MDARDLHDRIYRGEILHFTAWPAIAALVACASGFLEDAFRPHEPTGIHRHHGHAAQVELFGRVQRAFGRSDEVKRLWRAVFEAAGLDPSRLARDRLHLRFQPHRERDAQAPRARATATIAFHRDTWGSNLYAQTNWWAPVYPITAGRTVALFPELWSRPLRNSSADFDIRAVVADDTLPADALVPRLLEAVDPALAVPVVVAPGSMIAFSGAHAHAGVPNHTGVTRISLETRTLWIDDVRQGRGAPNVDGAAPWMTPGFFRRVGDGTPLDAILGLDRIAPFGDRRPVPTPSTGTTRIRSA